MNSAEEFYSLQGGRTQEANLSLPHAERLAQAWQHHVAPHNASNIRLVPDASGALREIDEFHRKVSMPITVLITGSLYLVGGFLRLLQNPAARGS